MLHRKTKEAENSDLVHHIAKSQANSAKNQQSLLNQVELKDILCLYFETVFLTATLTHQVPCFKLCYKNFLVSNNNFQYHIWITPVYEIKFHKQ
jgi:hypothetical protein